MTEFVSFHEAELARRAGIPTAALTDHIKRLEKLGILDYLPSSDKPQIAYLDERLDGKDISISRENYHDRMKEASARLDAMVDYAESVSKCRSQLLLGYFGETESKRCGKCDVCLERNKLSLNEMEYDEIVSKIRPLLEAGPTDINGLVKAAYPIHEDKVIMAVRWLIDNGKIVKTSEGCLKSGGRI
jgi:ATP-dependent DNA helicase RecQ